MSFFLRFFGTSSKPAANDLSVLSSLKKHKYVAISSSIFNYLISSLKNLRNAQEKSKLKLHNIDSLDVSSLKTIPPLNSTQKSDESQLEQAFFDSLAVRDASKRHEDNRELQTEEMPRKGKISKTSLEQRSRFLVQSLTEAVSSGSQLLRLEEICKHLLLYPHQKSEMCKAGLIRTSLHLRSFSEDVAVKAQARTALTLVGYVQPPKAQGIRILSIDGGGTRGIIAIEVLRQLEAKTNKKVHQLFDFVCGVSSGAILSILLGALHMSLDDCELLYHKLSQEIFNQSTLWGTGRLMWNHAYYDTTTWVNVLKKTFGDRLMIDSSKCTNSPKIAVFSAIMNLPHLQPFVFRNYGFAPHVQSHYLGSCQYRMWEAVRASGAAPGYFEEYSLDEYLHQDGGIMVNNPTALGIHEARLIWPSEPIQCVLSLGSGRSIPANQIPMPHRYTSLKTKALKVIDSATDTEGVHVVLNDLLSPYTYFRINPYLTEFFALDENRPSKLDQMKSDTQMYLRRNEFKFKTCAMTLSIPRSYLKRVKHWLYQQKDLVF